jgi:hypothetical protein
MSADNCDIPVFVDKLFRFAPLKHQNYLHWEASCSCGKGVVLKINYPDLLRAEVWVFSSPEIIEQAKLNVFERST